jgi:serine protease Do
MKIAILAASLLFLTGCTQAPDELVSHVKRGTVLVENKIDTTNGGIGTGFILEDNVIVTNNHVIDGKGQITIYASGSPKKFPAEVVYADPVADLAVVRLKDWDKFEAEENPVNLHLGDSDAMIEGKRVVIVGHPWGLKWSVSQGIISGKYRRVGANPQFVDQVDAHLFQGNSGGPIFNENGEVICVSNMMLTGEGGSYGFCIPSNLVKKVLHDFNTLKEVRWRALNVTLGLTDDGSSVIIESVEPNGAAALAGLKPNDKIIAIYTPEYTAGRKIEEVNDAITTFALMNGDDEKVQIVIDRNGTEMTIDVNTHYRLSKEYPANKSK